MLGFALRVLLAAAAVATVAAIVVYVAGTITRSKLEEKLRENGIEDAMIKAIDYCENVVTIEDMDSNKTLEIHGDDVSYDLYEGDRIYV